LFSQPPQAEYRGQYDEVSLPDSIPIADDAYNRIREAILTARSSRKLVMESMVERKPAAFLHFLHGLRGELHVTWERRTRAP